MGIFLNKISQTIFTVAYMKGVEQKHSSLRELLSPFRWPRFAALSQIQKHTTKKWACQSKQFIATDINRERETGENNKLSSYILKVTQSNS